MTTRSLTTPRPTFAPEGVARSTTARPAEPGVMRLLREIGESALFVPYRVRK